ncbi:hypothetical protein [[Limnothrix rosea] IAM M-220]|uniref:hypothetical protein n=1 Tax=[Limnothrix rosea] IAM M-220 TaxID=454133 RepID=UPI000965A743|nr:hypothetical protein [[Limnothrix rosea] IAM M-220]OKH19716.1 hypothetical protein NIES208_00885 [[Limnothrix rosea] IAM M-220]
MGKLFAAVLGWAIALGVCVGLWGCANTVAPEAITLAIEPNQDWTTVQYGGLQLDIPPNFVAGQPGLELKALQASLVAAGFENRTGWLAQNAEEIALLAFEATGDQLTAINVIQVGRSPDETLENYVAKQVTQLEAAGITVELLAIETDTSVGALKLQTENQEQLIYVYPGAEEFWVVTYSGEHGQLAATTIERSRRSVEILTEAE